MLSLISAVLAATAALLPVTNGLDLYVNSADSIKNASSTLAFGLMSWYTNNQSDTEPTAVGTLPQPLYWWEAGAVWGGLVDYWAYTGDTSYNPTVTQGLLAQVGPDNNYMPPAYFSSLGNDDQAFWALACLSAAESGFPTPLGNSSTVWLNLAEAVWNTQVPRWETATCNGGLRWQVFRDAAAGWNYKNSVSNGALFQISARLAKLTGNQTYIDWAEKVWDWMEGVKLIDDQYNVFDGTNPAQNCSTINKALWTYNPSMVLYGAAVMSNITNSDVWSKRTTGLATECENTFFSPYANSTNIAFERQCEPYNKCNNDQYSFKAYLARWMAKASVVAPSISDSVTKVLTASAQAAAQACSGSANGTVCGQKWYVGGYDGKFGVGQQLSALETVHSLLLLYGDATAALNGTSEKSSAVTPRGRAAVGQQTKTITETLTTQCTEETNNATKRRRDDHLKRHRYQI